MYCSFSQFPQFWTEVEEDSNDLLDVKSVLSVLGFKTKSSLSSIKSMANLNQLEGEYAKMRANKPTEMFSRYPELENIDFFSPGMKTIILELALRFNPKAKPDLEKTIKGRVLRQAKKVMLIFDFCVFD